MTPKQVACVHHWILGVPARDGSATGRCKRCQLERVHTGGVPTGAPDRHTQHRKSPALIAAEHELLGVLE